MIKKNKKKIVIGLIFLTLCMGIYFSLELISIKNEVSNLTKIDNNLEHEIEKMIWVSDEEYLSKSFKKNIQLNNLKELEKYFNKDSIKIQNMSYNISDVYMGKFRIKELDWQLSGDIDKSERIKIFINASSKENIEKVIELKDNEYLELGNPSFEVDKTNLNINYEIINKGELYKITELEKLNREDKISMNLGLSIISFLALSILLVSIVEKEKIIQKRELTSND